MDERMLKYMKRNCTFEATNEYLAKIRSLDIARHENRITYYDISTNVEIEAEKVMNIFSLREKATDIELNNIDKFFMERTGII